MSVARYKIHGITQGGKHTKEYPATSDITKLVGQAHSLGNKGFDVALYMLTAEIPVMP